MTAACNTPAHHFPEEMLLDYTAGSLPEGLSILVATHLSLCPACRAVVADCEAVGGELLSGLAPVALASDALDKVLGTPPTSWPGRRWPRASSWSPCRPRGAMPGRGRAASAWCVWTPAPWRPATPMRESRRR